MKIRALEATPNPLALKCALEPASGPKHAPAPLRSYRSPAEARDAGDQLAQTIMAIPGVASVLIRPDFITIVKLKDAPWPPLRRALKLAIESHPQPGAGP